MARVEVESEVQGNVWTVDVVPGDRVVQGDVLLIVESMKMEIPVEAPVSGVVTEVLVAQGDEVEEAQALVVIEDG
jgi:acetyl-CoA carboxylase biotin carboxyl carrier protein